MLFQTFDCPHFFQSFKICSRTKSIFRILSFWGIWSLAKNLPWISIQILNPAMEGGTYQWKDRIKRFWRASIRSSIAFSTKKGHVFRGEITPLICGEKNRETHLFRPSIRTLNSIYNDRLRAHVANRSLDSYPFFGGCHTAWKTSRFGGLLLLSWVVGQLTLLSWPSAQPKQEQYTKPRWSYNHTHS